MCIWNDILVKDRAGGEWQVLGVSGSDDFRRHTPVLPRNFNHQAPMLDHPVSSAVFTTDRLVIRRWNGSETDDLLAVYGDTDAMRWVGDGVAITRDQCVRWIEVTLGNYEKRGYGMFAIEDAGSGKVVGFAGLVHPGDQREPEVKYAFLRSQWGRGLATETVKALIDFGHRAHNLNVIIATTAPANVASHKVLLKAGFVYGQLRENEDGGRTQVFVWKVPHEGGAP